MDKITNVTAVQIPTKIKKADAHKYNITYDEYEQFIRFKKADVQIQLMIQMGKVLKVENLSLKKANSNADFNQIDKRTVDDYQKISGFDNEVVFLT